MQLASVCASSHEAEHIAYESTVTTDMAYYESASMSGKTQSYHDEYEYVAAPESKYSKKGKGSKKSRYHHEADHTMEPTEHFSYTSAPTELDSFKGKTDGGHHKSRKSGNHHEEEYTMEYSSFSMESIAHSSSKGSKKEPYAHLTHAPAHSSGKGMDGNSSKRSKAGKSGHNSSKGKGSKHAKKGGSYENPAPYPNPSPNTDYPGTRPPTHVIHPTPSPVSPGSITSSPTDSGSVSFELSPFFLLYETVDKRQATRLELTQVTDVTRLFLEEFMFDELTGSAFTFLDDFITRMITSTYVTGDAPYVINYSATARFNPFSTVFLSEQQLDEAVVIAFTGANIDTYTNLLKGLPSENVFHSAQVFFGDAEMRSAQRSDTSNAAGIAAAAVAASLVAAGIVLYRRRQQPGEKNASNTLDKKGDGTVAGETYTGYSYDGTASFSGSMEHGGRFRDEEDEEGARSKQTLGTINEEDGASLRPRWGTINKSSYDDDDSSPSDASNGTGPRFGAAPPQSFDQMALQGLATMVGSQSSSESNKDDESSSQSRRRPRTVEEIEAMLCSENDDDDVSIALSTRSMRSGGNEFISAASSSQRPRTVEEIESLLSEGLDDEATLSIS